MNANDIFYWVVIPFLKIAALVFAVLPLGVAFFTLAERKLIAFIQVRLGPMRVGPWGLLQPIADVVKLFQKEDITPSKANKVIFTLAPIIAIVPAFLTVAVLPLGPPIQNWPDKLYCLPAVWIANALEALTGQTIDRTLPLSTGVVDLDIGLLFVLAIGSLGIFAILLAGWASNSKYPLLGGLRSAAQMISYEVPLGFALIAGLLMTRTLSMQGIIQAQMDLGMSLLWLQPVSFFLYFVSGIAETNRVPFDLPEAETELVSGFHTEYSGMRFAFFFLAEYVNMVTVSAIAATMFMGGWLPFGHSLFTVAAEGGGRVPAAGWEWLFSAPAGLFFFVSKIAICYILFFWIRGTLPRYRYDQLMALGWKVLIPLSMLNVLLVGVGVAWGLTTGWGRPAYLLWMVLSLLVTLFAVYVIRFWRGENGQTAVELS